MNVSAPYSAGVGPTHGCTPITMHNRLFCTALTVQPEVQAFRSARLLTDCQAGASALDQWYIWLRYRP